MRDYPIKLGSMLFTMVEPHRGHEVEYNRWYERDHFYSGCMIGPNTLAGGRFVAPKPYKQLRYPATSMMTPDPMVGSFLALYWILAGHHDDWNRWAVDQVNWLHANGRMFTERDHIHTLLYDFAWASQRSADGPSPELALDHRYGGLVVVVGEQVAGADAAAVRGWFSDQWLPSAYAATPALDQVLTFTPMPLLADAPGDVPRAEGADRRFLQLHFLDADPAEVWTERYAGFGAELDASGVATCTWLGPFIPTVVGTDTYTDQLW